MILGGDNSSGGESAGKWCHAPSLCNCVLGVLGSRMLPGHEVVSFLRPTLFDDKKEALGSRFGMMVWRRLNREGEQIRILRSTRGYSRRFVTDPKLVAR